MSVIANIIKHLPLSTKEVELLIFTAPRRYKVHLIEKRNGRGNRVIAQPTAEIKLIQRLMIDEYAKKLPISDAAKAYIRGDGIIGHAAPHAKNKYLLKLDFNNFFNSIKSEDFVKHLNKYSNIEGDDINSLANIFFWSPKYKSDLILSIGAPSSPTISNTLMFDFDIALINFCEIYNVTYTRYADDIALSTNTPNTLKIIHEYIINYCQSAEYPKISLNTKKTVYTSKKHRRQLTGLILANDGTPSLGRDRQRQLRAMLHQYKKGTLPLSEYSKLRGWIAFAMSIDMAYVETLKKLINETCFHELMSGAEPSAPELDAQ